MKKDDMLWKPSKDRLAGTVMTRYMNWLAEKRGEQFENYHPMWRWSVENREAFWESIWEFGNVRASTTYERVVENSDSFRDVKWFSGARLNFSENLLRFRDDRPAIVFQGEGQPLRTLSTRDLYDRVAGIAKALRDSGITAGDRVVGFMPNLPETVIFMLAAVSIGAIWSSCSPDFGIKGVLDRFGQIEPRVLLTADGYFYNGKTFNSLDRISGILKDLPSVEQVVVVPYTTESPDLTPVPGAVLFDDFLKKSGEIEFEQLPFDHPIYILYSSGTTGVPKCIVHGAGGTLLQHIKELWLHTDVTRESRIFYYTTCGWMMWNWLVSSLTAGSPILLYDGSPVYPDPSVLWRFAESQRMTVFGTSAKYLAAIEKAGFKPGREFDLSALETICSTGSPLSSESFEYVYRDIKKDVCLSSISGGTDIISCFALGNPNLPVVRGELQCRGLGMRVDVFDGEGKPLRGGKGELVCTAPFVSMPVGFWNDPEKKKYRAAYFERFPNVWHHGDFAEITETYGVIISGRSDATLNPGGVRIGTAEIYRQVEGIEEVMDSLVVGQNWDNDVRVILFVKLREGVDLTDDLKDRIRKTIRRNATPRHVPAKILAVMDIPYTISGKKVELAVRNVIHGEAVLNRDALADPEVLDEYRSLPELEE